LQKLEGFTFATALDLNMGYYTTQLDPDASKIAPSFFMGEVFLLQVANGHCKLSQQFSGKDVRAYGSLRIC